MTDAGLPDIGCNGSRSSSRSKPLLRRSRIQLFDRSEIPGRGIGEIVAESRPRALAPAVRIGKVADRDGRMERLDDQRSIRREQTRDVREQVVDGFVADEREVGDGDVDLDLERAGGDVLI